MVRPWAQAPRIRKASPGTAGFASHETVGKAGGWRSRGPLSQSDSLGLAAVRHVLCVLRQFIKGSNEHQPIVIDDKVVRCLGKPKLLWCIPTCDTKILTTLCAQPLVIGAEHIVQHACRTRN